VSISRQVCPFHADEDIQGVLTKDATASVSFTCERMRGHPHGGRHSWLYVPEPDGLPGIDGYAAELGLETELPAAIAQYRGQWVEYGVAERAYALQCPGDFAAIVDRYGHTAIGAKKYTASAFLAGVLGVLGKRGTVLYHLVLQLGTGSTTALSAGGRFSLRRTGSPPPYRGPTASKTCPMY
jgi:hypothetical protein